MYHPALLQHHIFPAKANDIRYDGGYISFQVAMLSLPYPLDPAALSCYVLSIYWLCCFEPSAGIWRTAGALPALARLGVILGSLLYRRLCSSSRISGTRQSSAFVNAVLSVRRGAHFPLSLIGIIVRPVPLFLTLLSIRYVRLYAARLI